MKRKGEKGRGGVGTAVEGIRLGVLVGLLGGRVGDGVLDPRGLAAPAGEHGVQGVDEEGGRGGEEDVAVCVFVLVCVVMKGAGQGVSRDLFTHIRWGE